MISASNSVKKSGAITGKAALKQLSTALNQLTSRLPTLPISQPLSGILTMAPSASPSSARPSAA